MPLDTEELAEIGVPLGELLVGRMAFVARLRRVSSAGGDGGLMMGHVLECAAGCGYCRGI